MKAALKLVCAAALVSFFAQGALAEEKGGCPLFDGKTLDGWVQHNGTATYRVEDGTIVGKTNEGSPNSFLCTKKDY
ncbi:MAG: family 16 glycoside hydrolase, partial [Planctomycetota bacterium]